MRYRGRTSRRTGGYACTECRIAFNPSPAPGAAAGHLVGSGNHRGSIFRLLIGQALLARTDVAPCKSWGVKSDVTKASLALQISRAELVRDEEPVERAVTDYVRGMPFLWLDVDDEPGRDSLRGIVERNAIALLSNHDRPALDPPSPGWLGHASGRPLVRGSGLWNQRHVDEAHNPRFLDTFEMMIAQQGRGD